jgi:hypothetical protein
MPAPAFVLAVALASAVSAHAGAQTCGEELVDTRDGRRYPTVPIGEQCWMGRNLDHGRALGDPTSARGPGVSKRCYGNDAEKCPVYGGPGASVRRGPATWTTWRAIPPGRGPSRGCGRPSMGG